MNHVCRAIAAVVVALILVSPIITQADPHPHALDEDAALDLLERTLKHDDVYKDRISLDCVTYGTEEITDMYFQFVLREKHDAKCGGDPDTNPAIDRYRVLRASGKIEWWKATDDSWHRYNPAKIR
jgi:hypothetical protein